MFENALLIDAAGQPTQRHHQAFSQDWDRIKEWSDSVYMPYTVTPIGKRLQPASEMYSASVGRIDITRFCYGIPVTVGECSPEAGNILVLTTVRGNGRHDLGDGSAVDTAVGETFVADCSRTDYFVEFDDDHLQLNLTVPHQLVAEYAQQWYGLVPDDRLWQHKCSIGGRGSSWLALMDYVVRAVAESPEALSRERLGVRVEELITAQLLEEWAAQAGLQLSAGIDSAEPVYVRAAEDYIDTFARSVPTASEIAVAAGVSVRALTAGFRRYRDTTPSQLLRERRLAGVRSELLLADGRTVSDIANSWGYVNLGMFAASYRKRFGELPSQTRLRT
ncbi:helix-turn-helix transcriptional regulator [Rhodococcus sp. IEGM 1379]|uniref:AraC family transcriptional regulator n=1 Tax=Rhodococcus sp. IEGM 1379 TaxID=3047086 RepID=UPI0024B74917|nr:helix-turn-helix transcriptional regulator [Rhodococcus sp. IEGM 1379]MDI9917570.1 helix-turn-helix transcriptional regulator [Rhodococcus sp. IEGM 1379]